MFLSAPDSRAEQQLGATIGNLERIEPGNPLLPERFIDESLEFAQIDRTQRGFLML